MYFLTEYMEKTGNYFIQASISYWVVLELPITKEPNIYLPFTT